MSLKSSRGGRKIDQGMFSLRIIVSASNHLDHHMLTSLKVSSGRCLIYVHDPLGPFANGFRQFRNDD